MKRAALVALLLAACSQKDPANTDARCQPFAPAGECLLPWPSSFYLKADSSTATGLRVALPDGVMPQNQAGQPFETTRIDRRDGFSPATTLLAYVGARVDGSKLPAASDFGASLALKSAVQLFRYDTRERVPLFAEVDANALDGEPQLVLIHPAVRLEPATRYVVALRGLTDVNGAAIELPAFDALKHRHYPAASRLNSVQNTFDEIFALVESQGVERDSLTLAWDFVTGSDGPLQAPLIRMRDQALAAWESQNLGYTITQTNNPTDDHLLRELVGTYAVPSFLQSDDGAATLLRDGDGNPMLRGVSQVPFVLHIPTCARAATGPLPIMVYGHGLFGSAIGEMNSAYQKEVIDRLCMVQVGTNWIGLSSDDVPTAASQVVPDLSHFDIITDRLHQAQVNVHVLARLARRLLKDDPALQLNGKPVTDGSEIYYYGISEGGINGNIFLALSPDVDRGVLNVGGGEWSFMLPRSVDFKPFKSLLNSVYPAQRDQAVLLSALQSDFDEVDPITFVGTSLAAPLPSPTGAPLQPRHLLMQEAIADAQVPNLATRLAVRAAGLSYVGTPIELPYAVTRTAGPADSGYTQWDVHALPVPPTTNLPPLMDNVAHEAIRRLDKLQDQLAAFLRPDGKVVDTCGGPCVYPAPPIE